jgi:hypothetical protein
MRRPMGSELVGLGGVQQLLFELGGAKRWQGGVTCIEAGDRAREVDGGVLLIKLVQEGSRCILGCCRGIILAISVLRVWGWYWRRGIETVAVRAICWVIIDGMVCISNILKKLERSYLRTVNHSLVPPVMVFLVLYPDDLPLRVPIISDSGDFCLPVFEFVASG